MKLDELNNIANRLSTEGKQMRRVHMIRGADLIVWENLMLEAATAIRAALAEAQTKIMPATETTAYAPVEAQTNAAQQVEGTEGQTRNALSVEPLSPSRPPAAAAPREPVVYLSNIPDHHDRFVWQGRYYSLPPFCATCRKIASSGENT